MKNSILALVVLGFMNTGLVKAEDAGSQPKVDVESQQILQKAAQAFAQPSKMEKGAWLGVRTSHAQQVLLKQLKLKSGLVVESVEPGSPAEKAGLKVSDLLVKLDDQLLINAAQLSELIRQHEPGQSVALTVIREGQEQKITASLVEHDVPALADADPSNWLQTTAGLTSPDQTVTFSPMTFGDPRGVQNFTVMTQNGNVVDGYTIYRNNGREYRLNKKNDGRTLIIKDAAGKELFNGPVNSPDDEAKIPEDLKGGYQSMKKMQAHVKVPVPVTAPDAKAGENGL